MSFWVWTIKALSRSPESSRMEGPGGDPHTLAELEQQVDRLDAALHERNHELDAMKLNNAALVQQLDRYVLVVTAARELVNHHKDKKFTTTAAWQHWQVMTSKLWKQLIDVVGRLDA
jgi:hypothetical protein